MGGMNYTMTDQKVARFMEADYEKTGQWRRLTLDDIEDATDLTADQVNESVLRLGEGELVKHVNALGDDGYVRVSTFAGLSEEGRLLAQSR